MRVRPKERRLVTAGIVVFGWGLGIPLYVLTPPDDPALLGMGEDSKAYVDQLERIGGKSAVLGQELSDGFVSLWHGPQLGLTLGVLGLIAAFIYWLATEDFIGE